MATTKVQTVILGVILAAGVLTPLGLQRQAQARLRDRDEALRQQTNQLAQLTADNQRLAGLLARSKSSRALPDNRELLKLRAEVGHLKRSVYEMSIFNSEAPLSAEEKLALLKRQYAGQVTRLKEWLEANPAEKIPELTSLPDQYWTDAVSTLETDDDFARAMSSLRANAELRVLGGLQAAMRQYSRDNNGQFPADLSQLKPYFGSSIPIDDAILQRYAIVAASNLPGELQPGGDWVITQTAPVNAELDLRAAYGLSGGSMADARVTNRWNTAQ
jgi:type II secretory pathway pseudopilin PulG